MRTDLKYRGKLRITLERSDGSPYSSPIRVDGNIRGDRWILYIQATANDDMVPNKEYDVQFDIMADFEPNIELERKVYLYVGSHRFGEIDVSFN